MAVAASVEVSKFQCVSRALARVLRRETGQVEDLLGALSESSCGDSWTTPKWSWSAPTANICFNAPKQKTSKALAERQPMPLFANQFLQQVVARQSTAAVFENLHSWYLGE